MQFTWEKIQWSWRALGLPKKHLKHPFHPITKSMFFSYLDESQIPYGYPENVCMKCRLTFTIKLLTLIVISRGTWDLWVSGCPWHILGHTLKAQTAFQSSPKRILAFTDCKKIFAWCTKIASPTVAASEQMLASGASLSIDIQTDVPFFPKGETISFNKTYHKVRLRTELVAVTFL